MFLPLLVGYRDTVLQSLHQVTTLDGADRLGNALHSAEESPMDVPGLEDFLEFLISSDASVNEGPVSSRITLFSRYYKKQG